MASPQRQPDPQQPRELEDMQHRDLQKEISPRWRFGYWWWAWLVVFGCIWWLAFGWGNSGGYIWGNHGASAARPANDAVLSGPGVPILNASNKTVYIGQAFNIRNVPVNQVVSHQAAWIGSANNSIPMLVVVPHGDNAGDFAPGQWVNVTGRIQKAPPANVAAKQWGLNQANVQRLETEGAYVQANQFLRDPRR